jgi:hypothetical protein
VYTKKKKGVGSMKFYVQLDQKIRQIFFKDLVFINTRSNDGDIDIDLSNEENVSIREETEETYGLCIKENRLYLTANGEMVPFVVPENHRVQSYGHNYSKRIKRLPRSGIEVETDNRFTTAVVYSLTRHVRKRYSHRNIKFDGSLNDGLEFLMNLSTWIKILPYIKQSLKFQSTHIHFSTIPLLTYFITLHARQNVPFASLFVDLYDDWGDERDEDEMIERFNQTTFADACNVVFGRYFNGYATPFLRNYRYDRYAFITVPKYEEISKNNFSIKSGRITVEIRITKLISMKTMIHFLRLLERIYQIVSKEETISIDTFINAIYKAAHSTDVPTDKKQQQQTMLQLWKKLVRIDRKLNNQGIYNFTF